MNKKQILVCDDNEDTLKTLALALPQILPSRIVILKNGREVMDYLQQQEILPDLMILDLMLPDLEGDDIIKVLRDNKKFKNLCIILMSGIIYNVDNRAKAVGADAFLKKPFTLEELRGIIEPLLEDQGACA